MSNTRPPNANPRPPRRAEFALVWAAAALIPALAAGLARADRAPWIGREWTVRRVVDAAVTPSAATGEEVAVCAFYSGGMIQPGGRDVRVATAGRSFVPHKVLQTGPGDLVRVAFAAHPAETRYYVYYGHPEAPEPESWTPRRGLLLEVRAWPGGNLGKLDKVQAAWSKAEPIGADFVPTVHFGHNPFADSATPAVFRFTGYFEPAEAGLYEIATSSQGPSWLFVDGKQAVAWAGDHGAVADARHAGKVVLKKEVHRLDYWYVATGGHTIASAAVRGPDARRFFPIPEKAFLPVARAKLVELDLKGERFVADFWPETAGEAWWPDHYPVRVRFHNLSRGVPAGRGGGYEWDFGDGQSSRLANPVHVYLAHGDYSVTLKALRGTESQVFRTKVRIERDWRTQAERTIESARQYAEMVAQYDFQTLSVESLALAVDLLDHQKMAVPLRRALETLVLGRPKADERLVARYALMLAEKLRADRQSERAVEVLRNVEKRVRGGRKAHAAVEIADILLRDLRRRSAAEAEYQRVLQQYAAGNEKVVRQVWIGLGDIRRHQGDAEKARQAYDRAASISLKARSPRVRAVRIGTLARYVEEYTREREWAWAEESLEDWAWEFPREKLDGHWSYLKARLEVARDRRDEALVEAHALLASNPASAYAVRLLILAAECQDFLGHRDKARLLLQTAVEDYPEDAHRPEAASKLKTLGGPIDLDPAS